VKKILSLLLFSTILVSCSSFSGHRTLSSTNAAKALSCNWTVNSLILKSLSPKLRAEKLYALKKKAGVPLHLDLGGEGRYSDAININPQPHTSTTGEWGREIPFWVKGRSDDIPFADNTIDKITVENAPISLKSIQEMLRVLRPRGHIYLSHPEDYAQVIHQMVIDAFPNAEVSSQVIETNLVTNIKFLAR